MVLTKPELIDALQHEVRILLHLATKIDPSGLEYRPTAKQRSTLDLLRYLSFMGPFIVQAAKAGRFDPEAWKAAERASAARDLEQTIAVIARQADEYAALLADVSDSDFRAEIQMFGRKSSRGATIVRIVLGGCAAYRTQLFLYLKSCGREELTTMNLWAGMDAPVAV